MQALELVLAVVLALALHVGGLHQQRERRRRRPGEEQPACRPPRVHGTPGRDQADDSD